VNHHQGRDGNFNEIQQSNTKRINDRTGDVSAPLYIVRMLNFRSVSLNNVHGIENKESPRETH
jgi:hypothetical protein